MIRYWILIFLFMVGLVWSGIYPYNTWHWVGEVAPNLIGLFILAKTFRKFRFTFFTYGIILLACWFMFIGAHYTFSRVPYVREMGEVFGFTRNNFDKIGHFVQGVVPMLVARELFLRRKLVVKPWVEFLAFSICLSTAMVYEIVELIACFIAGKNIETFTGTQGFVWDSQTDMLAAMLGGLFVLFFLKKFHNNRMRMEFPDEEF